MKLFYLLSFLFLVMPARAEDKQESKTNAYALGEGNEPFDPSRFDEKTGIEKAAGKGIYFGESLKALDENRKQRSFEPGGLRDQYRDGAGQPARSGRPLEPSWIDKSFGKPDEKGLRYSTVDRDGYNPNNAAPKANNNRSEPPNPAYSMETAKRIFSKTAGIDYDANKRRLEAARQRWAAEKTKAREAQR